MAQFRLATNSRVPLPGAVHLWTINLNQPASVVSSLMNVLDASERARALRLWEGPLRSRFVVAHGATRQILAQYLGIPPTSCSSSGRPAASRGSGSGALVQRVSLGQHRDLRGLYGGRLGVDLEQIRPIANADAMASRFFAPGESRHTPRRRRPTARRRGSRAGRGRKRS